MPRVENSLVINAPVEKVFVTAKDVEQIPPHTSNVKSVVVQERDGNRVITAWTAFVPDFKITVNWTEEDIWDDESKECTFRLKKGDYAALSGKWTFREVEGGTEFSSVLDYEYNVPLIGALIQGLIQRIVKENMDEILGSVKKRLEG